MEKIIRIALEARYPEIDALIEVVNATANPTIAAEILLGIYEEPKIPSYPCERWISYNEERKNIKFISFEKFKQEITYSYQTPEYQTYWLKKGENKPSLGSNDINPDHLNTSSIELASKLNIPVEEVRSGYELIYIYNDKLGEIRTATMSLEDWLNY